MRKLLIMLVLLAAAGYVATQYLGKYGKNTTSNAKIAEEVLAP